jgi:hypothetical protein
LLGELEHLRIETRFIDEKFASVMGECVIKASTLARARATLLLRCEEKASRRKVQKSGQFPDEPVRIKV